MRTDTILRLGEVTIMAQKLKYLFGEPVLSQPLIKTRSNSATMLGSIIVYMVNSKKLWLDFTTTCTFASIGFQNFITKFITALFRQCKVVIGAFVSSLSLGYLALITYAPVNAWMHSTFDAQSCKSISLARITCIGRCTNSTFLHLLRIVPFLFISILMHIGIMRKSLFMFNTTAISTTVAETVISPFVGSKVFRGPKFKFLTLVAALQRGIILGYNIIHGTSPSSCVSSRSGVFQHCLSTTLLPQDYTTNPLHKQPHTHLVYKEIQLCHNHQRQEVG